MRSPMLKDFNNERETACVPGPTTELTGEFPARPMLFFGTAKAALLIHRLMLLLSGYKGTPGMMSARPAPSRFAKLVPMGSAPGATTVMNGPVWYSTIPETCQPPIT